MKRTVPIAGAMALALASLVVVAALSTTSADAGRGGKRGGGNPAPTTGACTVSPNPVAVNADFTVSGSGYTAGQYLTVAITSSGGTSFQWTQASSNGTFSVVSRVFSAGSNTAKVHDSVGGALLGTCVFSSH